MPTFGYEVTESASTPIADRFFGRPASSNSSGTGDSITALINWNVTEKVKCALYDQSDDSLVAETDQRETGGGKVWATFNFTTSPTISNNKTYYLTVWSDSNVNLYYKSETFHYIYRSLNYGSWPDPHGCSDYDTANFCVYCTYTEDTSESTSFQGSGRLAFGEGNSGRLVVS